MTGGVRGAIVAVFALLLIALVVQSWRVGRQGDVIDGLQAEVGNLKSYIETTGEIRNAVDDLPADPAGVLGRLCARDPAGPGCGNP